MLCCAEPGSPKYRARLSPPASTVIKIKPMAIKHRQSNKAIQLASLWYKSLVFALQAAQEERVPLLHCRVIRYLALISGRRGECESDARAAVRTASLLLWSNNFAWARPFSRVGRKCLGSAAPPPFISAAFPAGRAEKLPDPGPSSRAQLRTLGPRGLLALGRNFPFPLPPEGLRRWLRQVPQGPAWHPQSVSTFLPLPSTTHRRSLHLWLPLNPRWTPSRLGVHQSHRCPSLPEQAPSVPR